LLNARAFAFTLCISMKFDMVKIQAFDLRQLWFIVARIQIEDEFTCDQCINTILTFFSSYIDVEAHNMLVIMLDLCFKNIKVIQDYVNNTVVRVVVEYDVKVVYLLLL
jgi:hypothetical protein